MSVIISGKQKRSAAISGPQRLRGDGLHQEREAASQARAQGPWGQQQIVQRWEYLVTQSLFCILTLFWAVLLTCSECGCINSINMQDQSLINTRPGSSSQLPAPGPELMGSAVRDAAKRRMAAVEWIKSHPCHVISPAIKILPLLALNKKVGHPVISYKMSGIVWREQWPPCTLVTAQLSQLLWPDLTFRSNNGCGPKLNTHSY